MPHGLLHKVGCSPNFSSVGKTNNVAESDIYAIEDVVDDLLACDLAATDPFSLCMHDYLAVLQPLQLALEYTWALHSRYQAMQGTAARCLTAASDFRSALHSYVEAAQAELQQPLQQSPPSSRQSEQLRRQLRPLKKIHEAAKTVLKAEEFHNKQSQIALRSRTADVDWALVRSVQVPDLADVEGMQCLCNILHILTYADMGQQPWQNLTASDCLHFIQLAQCALKYMLHQASTAHSAMEMTWQQVHRQEAAITRLHQRSKECFRCLKSGQTAHPDQQAYIPSHQSSCHAQPTASPRGDHIADVQSLEGMGGPQMEVNGPAVEPQHRRWRSASPVRGSQVRYMASSPSPLLVQGHAPDTAASGQPTPASHSVDTEQGDTAHATDQDIYEGQDARRSSSLQGSGSLTQVLEACLRHEEQQLHEARSRVADLWAHLAAVSQQAAASCGEAACAPPSAPQMEGTAHMPAPLHHPIHHTTSLNVDLEAMRAAERRHAEARLRAVFADIKQKAFADITQRMNRSADARRNSSLLWPASSNAVSGSQSTGGTPKHASHENDKQLMQRFSSQAPISHLVKHLQSGAGLQRLSSSTSQAHTSMARPPKGRVFSMQPMSLSDTTSTQSKGSKSDLHKTPRSAHPLDSSPDKLMRLTSCVKLNKVPL